MNEELQAIVEEMVKAGESEEDIALVIRNYQPDTTKAEQPTLLGHIGELVENYDQPVDKKLPNPLMDAISRGSKLAEQTAILNPFSGDLSPSQIERVAQLQKETGELPASKAYQQFTQSKSTGEALSALVQNPIQIIGELTAESLSSLAQYGGVRIAAGAGLGALAGSVVPGVGTLSGAGVGATTGMADASLGLEYSSAFIESLREAGVDVSDPEQLKKAFADDDIVSEARSHGLKKGIPIALFDLVSGGVAGKIITKPAKSILGKVAKGAGEFGVQAGLGGAGEAAGQTVAGEELNPSAIIGEMIGELGTTPIEVTNAALTFNRNQSEATKLIEEFDTGDPQLNAEIDAAAQIDPVDKQVLEEKKLTEVAIEHQKEVERLEKLQEKLEDAENTATTAAKPAEKKAEKPPKPSETPEYKIAVEKVTKLQEQFAALPIDENADQLLFDLREARQALQKIAGKPKPGKKTEIQKQIEDTTGVTKPDKIQIAPNEAIKHQIQTFFRGMDKGVRKGKELTNQLVAKVQEAIKESPLQPKQISAILNRIKSTNLFTPGSISRLNTFIDKVSNNAEYADKLSEAKALNKKLRRLSKTSSSNLQNVKALGRSFASINPEDTFINPHLEMGQKLLKALTTPTNEKYTPVNVEEAQTYITDLQDKIAEYEEEQVAKEPDGEKRNVQLFATLRSSLEALQDKDLSEFDESEVRAIESIKTLDPLTLSDKQATSIVRVIDNIVENDDFSNAGAVEPIIKAKRNLETTLDKLKGIERKELKFVGKVGGNIYQQFTRIFSDSGIASEVQDLTGIIDLWNAGSRVENREIQYSKELRDKIKELNSKYKTRIQDLKNGGRLTALGQLAMNYGDNSHIEKVKSNIKRSALEYDKTDPEMAQIGHEIYEEVKNISSVEEAVAQLKKYPALYEIWKFNQSKFKREVSADLARTRAELHNQPYTEADNYSHIEFVNISDTSGAQESFMEGSFEGKSKVKQKAATTGITANRNLRQGTAYSFDWVGSQLKGFRTSLYDIEASPAKALVNQTLYSPEFETLIGGTKNAQLIRKMVEDAEKIQKGVGKSHANDAVKFLNSFTQFLRNLGAIRALASATQVFKQVPSVWVKSYINHLGSGSTSMFFKGISAINLISTSPNLKKLFDQYTVGVRGQRLGGIERGDSIGYRLSSGATKGWVKAAEWMQGKSDQFGRTSLEPLTRPDVYAARTTWLGYYLQKLKEQGVTEVDLNSEFSKQSDPIRKAAAAYAEQIVAETQVPSNPATLAQIVRNENDGGWNFAKNLLIPFSTFSLTAKYRNIVDVGKFLSNPSKRNAAAVAGDVSELLVFASIAYLMLPYYKDWLKSGFEELFGFEGDDDEEKRAETKRKAFFTNLTNAVTPFAIGQMGEYGVAKMANKLAYIAENPGMSYSDWKEETGGFVFEPREFDAGVFALGFEPIMAAPSGIVSLATETDSYESFGSEKQAQLSPEQQNLLAIKTLLEIGQIFGIAEVDTYNQIAKIYKEQLRQGSSGVTPRTTPRLRPRPRIPARNLN